MPIAVTGEQGGRRATLTEGFMKTTTRPSPARELRPTVLSSDFDATIVLLSLLIVALCGTAELMLMLPHALGAS
jgi:hypothetical protein